MSAVCQSGVGRLSLWILGGSKCHKMFVRIWFRGFWCSWSIDGRLVWWRTRDWLLIYGRPQCFPARVEIRRFNSLLGFIKGFKNSVKCFFRDGNSCQTLQKALIDSWRRILRKQRINSQLHACMTLTWMLFLRLSISSFFSFSCLDSPSIVWVHIYGISAT